MAAQGSARRFVVAHLPNPYPLAVPPSSLSLSRIQQAKHEAAARSSEGRQWRRRHCRQGKVRRRGTCGGALFIPLPLSQVFIRPDSDSQPLSALACSQILMARSPAKAAAVRPRLGGIPNPLPAPSACRLQDPVARKLCVLPCHGRGARRTRMYEANATATESTAKTSSTSKSLVPIDQRGDLQLGTAFTVSPLLTYAFMHASCLIKIQIERIVLDEIVANTVWW